MKILDGLELAGYIKERQAKAVRALRQSWKVIPKLAIIKTTDNPVIDVYVRLKKVYGEDIGVEVDILTPPSDQLIQTIENLNNDDSTHGIIVQLPLADPNQTNAAVNAVTSDKDVDGLSGDAKFTPATAMAIDWLLAGYGIDLQNKKIAIIGKGRLVGAPLAKLWKESGYDVTICDSKSNLTEEVRPAEVIVTATGVRGLLTSEMVRDGAIVVDAGTASEDGKILGDISIDLRSRDDLTITPEKGGVGPLTIAALFDNVITSARKVAEQKGQQDLQV